MASFVYCLCTSASRQANINPGKFQIFQFLLCSSVTTRANTNPGFFPGGDDIRQPEEDQGRDGGGGEHEGKPELMLAGPRPSVNYVYIFEYS